MQTPRRRQPLATRLSMCSSASDLNLISPCLQNPDGCSPFVDQSTSAFYTGRTLFATSKSPSRNKRKNQKMLDKCNLSVSVEFKLSLACRGDAGLGIPSRSSRRRVAGTCKTSDSRSRSRLETASERSAFIQTSEQDTENRTRKICCFRAKQTLRGAKSKIAAPTVRTPTPWESQRRPPTVRTPIPWESQRRPPHRSDTDPLGIAKTAPTLSG